MRYIAEVIDKTDQTQMHSSSDETFARLRFAGGRFDSHTIPLDVLPDLAAYRKLIVEVAKNLYKKANGTRTRVPKGFEDSFQIGLKSVIGGSSAIAEMPRIYTQLKTDQSQLAFSANEPHYPKDEYVEFEQARIYINDLIDRVSNTGKVPEDFPVELAAFFNPFGQNLRHDEFVELGFGTSKTVRYDTQIRKNIVLSREPTYENAVDAPFTLNGGAAQERLIHVVDASGARFDFQPQSEFEYKKAYGRAKELVRLVGTGLYDANERLKSLLDVSVIYEDGGATQPYEERLKQISETPAGWYDEQNPAPTKVAIDAMRLLLEKVSNNTVIPMPYLYPTPEGGVVGEWSIGDWEATAEIDLDAKSIELGAVNVLTERELSVSIKVGSQNLFDQFKSFIDSIAADGVNDAS